MKQFILLVLILGLSLNTYAKIWRVNVNPNTSPDFTDIQTAHDNASANDTLLIEAGLPYEVTSGSTCEITKPLCIMGEGYYKNMNGSFDYVNKNISKISHNLEFKLGSQGSIIKGLYVNMTLYVGNINVDMISGSITIRLYPYEEYINSVIVTRSKINYLKCLSGANAPISMLTGLYFRNCFIGSVSTGASNVAYPKVHVNNCNITYSSTELRGWVINNSILSSGHNSWSNVISINNCAFLGSLHENYKNNNLEVEVKSYDPIFISTSENEPNDYYRISDSETYKALKTFASDGGEVGIYGGSNPFVYGGVPETLPFITKLEIPDEVGNELKVEIEGQLIKN